MKKIFLLWLIFCSVSFAQQSGSPTGGTTTTTGGGGGGGGVASVSGTTHQIDSTGGANPVLSLDPAITFPGTFTLATSPTINWTSLINPAHANVAALFNISGAATSPGNSNDIGVNVEYNSFASGTSGSDAVGHRVINVAAAMPASSNPTVNFIGQDMTIVSDSNGTGKLTGIYGVWAQVDPEGGSQNVGEVVGFNSQAFVGGNSYSGTTDLVAGFEVRNTGISGAGNTGTITLDTGLYVAAPRRGSGTITRHAGVYLADQTGSGAGSNSDPWGIYEVTAAERNQLGPLYSTETSAPSGSANQDLLWADSTAHRWKMNNNNAGALNLVGIGTAGTSGHCAQLATNGIDIVDSGSATCGGLASGANTALSNLASVAINTSLLPGTSTGSIKLGSGSFPFGDVTLLQSANGDDLIYGQRNTNTAPTGNFINFQDQSGPPGTLFGVDVSGNATMHNGIVTGTLNVTGASTFQSSVTAGGGAGVAGIISMPGGTTAAGSALSGAWNITSPASVTATPIMVWPSAAATGIFHLANSGGTMTTSISAVNLAGADVTGQLPIGNVGSSGLSGTSPVTISAAGAIGCATCVTSAAALTSTAIMTGGGSQASQTPSATSTLDSSGNITLAGVGKFGSSPPACTAGSAGGVCFTEGSNITNVAGTTAIDANSTTHEIAAATNGSSSYGLLVRSQPGSIRSTGLTAAVSTATLCAASAGACNTAGTYHVHWSFYEGGTACGTPGTGGVTFLLTWTDANGTAHSAISLPMDDSGSLVATSGTFTFRTTLAAAWASGDFNIDTNGSIIQYATGYTACSVGTGTYALSATVDRLQ
jgi:fibronectin-binding autotransporter adhesin